MLKQNANSVISYIHHYECCLQGITEEFLKTFVEFPPLIGSSLGVDKVLQQLKAKPQN